MSVTAQSSAMDGHAEIGALVAIDTGNDRIVTEIEIPTAATNPGVERTYQTNFDTNVLGLGGILEVDDIPPAEIGQVVVVTFVPGEELPLAKSLYFPDEQEVLESTGVIARLDPEEDVMVITSDNREQQVDLGVGPGATIDSDEGLLSRSDLRVGQEVTVYHTDPASLGPAEIAEALVVFVH